MILHLCVAIGSTAHSDSGCLLYFTKHSAIYDKTQIVHWTFNVFCHATKVTRTHAWRSQKTRHHWRHFWLYPLGNEDNAYAAVYSFNTIKSSIWVIWTRFKMDTPFQTRGLILRQKFSDTSHVKIVLRSMCVLCWIHPNLARSHYRAWVAQD